MKNLLIATTALVATATVAAADVSISGFGRFAMQYDSGAADELSLHNRVNIDIKGSATADNGMTFGVKSRYRLTDESTATDGFNAPQYTIGMGAATLSLGNVCGAIECMPGTYAASIGITGMSYRNVVTNFAHDYYESNGSGMKGVQLDYSAGAFGLSVSQSNSLEASNDENLGVVVSYSANGLTVAAGMQDGATAAGDITTATVSYDMGSATVGAMYADVNGSASTTLHASFPMGGASLTAFYNTDDADAEDAIGLGVSMGMGGGVTAKAGFLSDTDWE